MKAVPEIHLRGIARAVHPIYLLCFGLALTCAVPRRAVAEEKANPSTVQVNLSEWKISLSPSAVPPGPVVLEVVNTGKVPHALEIEGRGVEKTTPRLAPGASATLTLDLRAGVYAVYCPIGKGSHKMLGMDSRFTVGETGAASANSHAEKGEEHEKGESYDDDDDDGRDEATGYGKMDGAMHSDSHEAMHAEMNHAMDAGGEPKAMKVAGGGTVVQILPGPFPFADSAMAVIRTRPGGEMTDLKKKLQAGPYSNNVAKIAGTISLLAIDRGASGDSVSGSAEFTARDGARWKLVVDRVQTKDVPFNPRFGGVIMGLYYHGATNVHTPLVPTIQSSVALWAVAHLYKDDRLVTDNAMVHVMLLSRTRRAGDWALDCWDCSERPVEELQLQVVAPPNSPPLDSPGGFLFVNWEKSNGHSLPLSTDEQLRLGSK